MSKLRYGADSLSIDSNLPFSEIVRSPRIVNGLNLPETYVIVDEDGDEISLDRYPVDGVEYTVEVKAQKKNAGPKVKAKPAKQATPRAKAVKPATAKAATKTKK